MFLTETCSYFLRLQFAAVVVVLRAICR